MPVGELRDDEGNLVHPGISGLTYPEYRSWKQFYMRKAEEERTAQLKKKRSGA